MSEKNVPLAEQKRNEICDFERDLANGNENQCNLKREFESLNERFSTEIYRGKIDCELLAEKINTKVKTFQVQEATILKDNSILMAKIDKAKNLLQHAFLSQSKLEGFVIREIEAKSAEVC